MKKTKFNWKCIHCDKRNIFALTFQFDIPKQYIAQWGCEKCGKETSIELLFGTTWPKKNENKRIS